MLTVCLFPSDACEWAQDEFEAAVLNAERGNKVADSVLALDPNPELPLGEYPEQSDAL